MANISGADRAAEERQKKEHWWEDCAPDCAPDCGDCGVPSCDCDFPGCDFSLMILTSLTLGGLFRHTPGVLARPGRPPRKRPTVPGRGGMLAIRGYQKWLSPRLRAQCRHIPNCSAYGMEAVRRYGLLTGSQLTADRIRRCKAPTPHGTSDPVP
jgi:putative membrane protein insertion efficiency factor